jgi:hypothetical protein
MFKIIFYFLSLIKYHLTRLGMWEKYTLYEETTRCPLIIADPRYPQHWGTHYWGVVELLDIVPTLIDLVNISRIPVLCPPGRLCPDFEGKSIAAAVRDGPTAKVEGIDFAISQLRRCQYLPNERPLSDHPDDKWNAICTRRNKPKGSVMGYSVRSNEWRYTAWFHFDNVNYRPNLSLNLVAEELYSHVNASIADLDNEVENLIVCEHDTCVTTSAENETVRSDHKLIIYEFLKNKMIYNIHDAEKRTIEKYSDEYVIKGKRAISRKVNVTSQSLFSSLLQ